jgi:predicted nucleic acid-binding protein
VAVLYIDTSALVKLYVTEDGTERMLELAHPDAGNRLVILSLAKVEFRAAVRRRARAGDIDGDVVDEILRQFEEHLAAIFLVQPVNDAVLHHAAQAIDRHGLRAYDAIQLGGCLAQRTNIEVHEELWFVAADEALLVAAQAEALVTVDPAA